MTKLAFIKRFRHGNEAIHGSSPALLLLIPSCTLCLDKVNEGMKYGFLSTSVLMSDSKLTKYFGINVAHLGQNLPFPTAGECRRI